MQRKIRWKKEIIILLIAFIIEAIYTFFFNNGEIVIASSPSEFFKMALMLGIMLYIIEVILNRTLYKKLGV